MPDSWPPGNASPEDAGGVFREEPGDSESPPAGIEDGEDAAAPDMWLTASTWLPAELLEALSRGVPGADGTPAVAAGFCQGGPLDAMPPGPALTAFLTEATTPRSTATDPSSTATDPSSTATDPSSTAAGDGGHLAGTGQVPGLAACGDDALIGIIRGWRKIASLAAGAVLDRHREAIEAEARRAGGPPVSRVRSISRARAAG